jgi:hypothetical protein
MSTKEKLYNKVSANDALLTASFHPTTSPYSYSGYSKLANHNENYVDLTPISTNQPTLGSEVRFLLPKRSTYIADIIGVITISALTPNGGGTARLVDYAGYVFMDQILVRNASNQIQTLDPKILYANHVRFHHDHLFVAEQNLVGGGLTVAERESRGSAPQTFRVSIPFWWTRHMQKSLIAEAISYQLEIVWRLPTAAQVTQATSGQAPTFSVTDIKLHLNLAHTEDIERNFRHREVLSDDGIFYGIRDWERQYGNVLAAGQTSYTIKLDAIKGSVACFMFWVKDYTHENSPGTVDNKPFTFKKIKRFRIVAGGLTIWETTDEEMSRFHHDVKKYPGLPGAFVYGYSPALDPADFINATGHDTFQTFSNPELVIEFDSDPGQCIVDIIAMTYNVIQHSKGEMYKLWH